MAKRRNPQTVTVVTADDEEVAVANPLPVSVQAADNLVGRVKITDGTDVADVVDLATYNGLAVAIVDGSGDQITSFGGGTQYTEDAAAAANPVGNALILVRDDVPGTLTSDDGDNVAARGSNYGAQYVTLLDSGGTEVAVGGGTQYTEGDTDASITGTAMLFEGGANTLVAAPGDATNGLDVDVTRSALPTGASTLAEQQSQTTHLATIAGDTTSIQTAVELVDDTVATLGTTTYTEAATKGLIIAAVRRDADTTLVDTTNEIAPLQVDASGRLKVEAFSGETLPVSVSGVSTLAEQQTQTTHLATIAGDTTDIEAAVELIDDTVATLGTTTYTEAATKGLIIGAVRRDADTTLVDTTNEIAPLQVNAGGQLKVAVIAALPAGTAAIGKLAANSGVDIGDVDVTTVTPGTGATNLGKAEDGAHASGDVGMMVLGVRTDTPNAARADTDLDYTPIATYRTGSVRTAIPEDDFAALGSNHVKKYYANTGAVTDGIVWSPAAGKRWYVTDLILTTSAAATVTFEDDKAGGDEIVLALDLAANSGLSHHFATPLFSGEDAADLIVTTSAGNIKITAVGYEI